MSTIRYGTGVLADGAFVLRYSVFLNTTNATAEWEIPVGECGARRMCGGAGVRLDVRSWCG